MDVIDLYQIHWPEPDEDIEEGWSTLAELQEQGKVRYIGVSNFNVAQMRRAQKIAPITSLQPPYSLVSPEVGQEILPFCLEQNIGVIVYAPMKSGLLTGAMTRERVANLPDDDFRKRALNFQEPHLSKNLALVEVLRKIGERHGRTPGEVAIAWTLEESGGDRRDSRHAQRRAGRRRDRRSGLPAFFLGKRRVGVIHCEAGGGFRVISPAVGRGASLSVLLCGLPARFPVIFYRSKKQKTCADQRNCTRFRSRSGGQTAGGIGRDVV